MNLILWDIDGTLLRAGPLAREVFDRAIEDVTGRHPNNHGVAMSGKTDPQITVEILASMEEPATRAADRVPEILDRLVARLAEEDDRLRREARALPGVPELLAALDARPGVVQAILSGNVAPNARAKTAAVGVDAWLDWRLGAYGSDHPDRAELVPVARQRAAMTLGRDPDRIWVIGDTPNDVACARAGAANCLLVATGRFERDELEGLGADAVVADLTETDRILGLVDE
ncbi:HAD family hydrolase [Egibacter rhizosphaerae]|uniref:HAD family hydrolase n=1 Tax=Egibacter rhizosphaerae TaxID=1670831 RepID=UPI0013F16D97|nr:haloacid dehalogenase-like hydrolase [Egibacter rhizosphaerae]